MNYCLLFVIFVSIKHELYHSIKESWRMCDDKKPKFLVIYSVTNNKYKLLHKVKLCQRDLNDVPPFSNLPLYRPLSHVCVS